MVDLLLSGIVLNIVDVVCVSANPSVINTIIISITAYSSLGSSSNTISRLILIEKVGNIKGSIVGTTVLKVNQSHSTVVRHNLSSV